MSRESINLSGPLQASFAVLEYVRRGSPALREKTVNRPWAGVQISPEQGQLMALLVRLLGARKTLEVGVFTGYSAMVVAKALGPKGKLVALDVNEEFTAIARRHSAKAGIADRIDLRIQPATDSLRHSLQEVKAIRLISLSSMPTKPITTHITNMLSNWCDAAA